MTTKANILLVPIRIDGLHLTQAQTVVEASADFRQLPHIEKKPDGTIQDRNANTAFLGEGVSSQPFQNINLTLDKGVHLHWALDYS